MRVGKRHVSVEGVVLNFDSFDLDDLVDYFITMPVLDALKGMVFTD